MTARIHSMFQTALIVDSVPGFEALNNDLIAIIRARREEDPAGLKRSNRLGWHSDLKITEWGGAPFRAVLDRVIANANASSIDIGQTSAPRYGWRANAWANVSLHGASNQSHVHSGAFWSAVYYAEDGYGGSADRALGGELVLEDPRMPALLMEEPDLRFRPRPDWAVAEPQRNIRPATGMLLMFPSWLRHGVSPYLGDRERVSVAINLSAQLRA